MFNAPNLIIQIPDIAQIYAINEEQGEQLDNDVEQINNDIFVDSMGDDVLKHWEKIFSIEVKDDASLEDRRFKVKSKLIERLPYSYRVMISKLNAMLPFGYDLYLNEDLTYMQVKVNLVTKYTLPDVQEFLEEIAPLNMFLEVILKYNTYGVLNQFTHGALGSYAYGQLVDEPIS